MKRLILHWSAGGYEVGALEKAHYHFIVDGDGRVHMGIHTIEDNDVTNDGDYAAHTRNCNEDAGGIAVAAMRDAVERPFYAGPCPIKPGQLDAFCKLAADLCRKYKLAVTPTTVLTHAEVQPVLGIKQRGKWDIARIPFKPELIGHKACGDYIRAEIRKHL